MYWYVPHQGVCFLLVLYFGGILGWDPVHTTCIPDEMMMML